MHKWEHFSFTARWDVSLKNFVASNFKADADIVGMNDIMTALDRYGWELVSVVVEEVKTHHPSERGLELVDSYRFFVRRPGLGGHAA